MSEKKVEWVCENGLCGLDPCYEYSREMPVICTKKPSMKPNFKQTKAWV
ncbi:MAG TPA: hypothetical protein VMY59_10025 [Candidatus Thermoplasmatota archaeon]|nr:hypothetical protein [Candidatus Thermoplasmatota archaeon]